MRPILIALLFAVLPAGLLRAQEDNTRGPQLGIHGGLSSWDLDPIAELTFEKESGPTFGGSIGYGMSDWLGLFTRFDLTWISPDTIDSHVVDHWDVGLRAIPQIFGSTVRPYVEAGGTFRFFGLFASNGVEVKGSGAGLALGAGLYVFVTPSLAVNAGATGAIGSLDTVTFNGFKADFSPDATSVRFQAGLTFFP